MSDHEGEETRQPRVAEEELPSVGTEENQDRILVLEAQVRALMEELNMRRGPTDERVGAGSPLGSPAPVRVQPEAAALGPEPLSGVMGPPPEEPVQFYGQRGPGLGRFQHGIGAGTPRSQTGRSDHFEHVSQFSFGGRRAVVQPFRPPSLNLSSFHGKNFALWKKDVIFITSLGGHWDVLSGKFMKPRRDQRGHILLGPDFTTYGTEEDVEAWEELQRQACAMIYNVLGAEQRQQVSKAKTAPELWLILENTYMRKSQANMAHVMRGYNDCKMGKGQSMGSYITAYQSCVDRCREVGIEISEKQLVLNLLNGLREDYQIDRKIMSRGGELTFNDAVGELLSEALIVEGKKGGSDSAISNLAEGSGSGGRGKRGGKGSGRGPGGAGRTSNRICYTCGEKGHFSTTCPKRPGGLGNTKAVCFVCNGEGHRAATCPNRVGSSSGGGVSANLTTGGGDKKSAQS